MRRVVVVVGKCMVVVGDSDVVLVYYCLPKDDRQDDIMRGRRNSSDVENDGCYKANEWRICLSYR